MNKNLIIGLSLLGVAAAAYIYKDKLFGSGTSAARTGTASGTTIQLSNGQQLNLTQLEGRVITAPNHAWAKIVNGVGYLYTSYDAYLKDGARQTFGVTDFDFQFIPLAKETIS